MTVKEFKELFKEKMAYPVENGKQNQYVALNWLLYNISDEEAIMGKHRFACVKIREQSLSLFHVGKAQHSYLF